MEKITYLPNGQWELEKGSFPSQTTKKPRPFAEAPKPSAKEQKLIDQVKSGEKSPQQKELGTNKKYTFKDARSSDDDHEYSVHKDGKHIGYAQVIHDGGAGGSVDPDGEYSDVYDHAIEHHKSQKRPYKG